jgi:iron uptake system EfeUOB component EfeO/EfeM
LGLVLELSLYRTPATPAAMLTNGELQLSWAVDACIGEHEELYAHLDFMDVAAQVQAVSTIVDAVTPLARNVAGGDFGVVAQRLGELQTLVATLGAASQRQNASIPDATWRALSAHMTALLEPLTTLAGDLYGYGTGRTYA